MNSKRVKLISGVMACLMIASLAGCSSQNSSSGSSNSTKKKNVTLTYMASQGHLEDAEEDLGKKFEDKTGIKVDYQVVPASQYSNLLQTKLNSGECTDIFMAQSGKFDIDSTYHVEKNAVDLSDQSWVSRMDKQVAEQLTVGGKLYGLMIWDNYSEWPIMYNKKIFSDLGISAPKTYAEFKSACQKIKDAGITPVWKAGADGWQLPLSLLDDGPNYEEKNPGFIDNLNNNKAKFADNETILTALNEYKELYTLGYFGDNMLSQAGSQTSKAMGSGKYAMTLTVLSEPETIAKANTGVSASDFGFFENPLADNDVLCSSPCGPSKFIYKNSNHIEEAEEYFDYITTPENLEYQLKNDDTKIGLCFTGISTKLTSEMKSYIDSYTKTGTYMQYEVKYLNSQWSDIDKDMQSMLIGSMTPKELLESIDSRRADQASAASDSAWN
jgi:raffinose/stachyose/melibiose transport system substrate-binding protein